MIDFFCLFCYNNRMNVELQGLVKSGETIAVALSGGSDSMALLNYLLSVKERYGINVIALNVEHGIRGEESIADSEFVANYCEKKSIPLLTYSVDCPEYSKKHKLTSEEGARVLRYRCFNDAVINKKCDKVATAHHLSDNAESLLMNFFRGTGLKGLTGIEPMAGCVIRPFLSVSKKEIEEYIQKNEIPYRTDSTNFNTEYTRNYIRAVVIPAIEKVFPEAQKSISRTAEILRYDERFLSALAKERVVFKKESAFIAVPFDYSLFSRATVNVLKYLGIKKDWTKKHIDDAFALSGAKVGCKVSLIGGITAIREYDGVAFYKNFKKNLEEFVFSDGNFFLFDKVYDIITVTQAVDLKDGLYIDADKVPSDAVIRTRRTGDRFTKFGGGTKSLGDYFTDIKLPQRLRDKIPLLATGNDILVIFGVAVSDTVKVDENTRNIKKIISERSE